MGSYLKKGDENVQIFPMKEHKSLHVQLKCTYDLKQNSDYCMDRPIYCT